MKNKMVGVNEKNEKRWSDENIFSFSNCAYKTAYRFRVKIYDFNDSISVECKIYFYRIEKDERKIKWKTGKTANAYKIYIII